VTFEDTLLDVEERVVQRQQSWLNLDEEQKAEHSLPHHATRILEYLGQDLPRVGTRPASRGGGMTPQRVEEDISNRRLRA
jgi:hypothetical protein